MDKIRRLPASIMDVTLRDGSYALSKPFCFSSADTSIICRLLEGAGVEYIEIGHGVGLNASNAGYGQALQTDEEYMEAADSVLMDAKWGMFCIPGIARLEDIDLAAEHHMDFIRIGTNVTEVEQSRKYIEKAKEKGMIVAANYMKSYASSPPDFASKVKLSESFGADLVYIVDSAGGMFAEDIRAYFKAIRDVSDLSVGFHGHDNLGLAVANSLAAVEIGIEFVDSSLQGFGRSSGNACTELLVTALSKLGYETGLDLKKIFEIGKTHIQPLLNVKGREPLDVISGYADFHSSYMPHIQRVSTKYRVDPLELIIEYSKLDKINMVPSLLEEIASRMKPEADVSLWKHGFHHYFGGEQEKK